MRRRATSDETLEQKIQKAQEKVSRTAAAHNVTAQSPLESNAIEHKSMGKAQAKRVPPERMVLKALIKSFPCRLHVSVIVSKEQ